MARKTIASLEARIAVLEAALREEVAKREHAATMFTKWDRQLVERSNELREARADAARLRQLCADWAHQSSVDKQTIARLKAQMPRRMPIADFAARCRAYCEENGVRSVPAEVVREWRAQA